MTGVEPRLAPPQGGRPHDEAAILRKFRDLVTDVVTLGSPFPSHLNDRVVPKPPEIDRALAGQSTHLGPLPSCYGVGVFHDMRWSHSSTWDRNALFRMPG
jgi:hypothetical protein